MAEARRPADRVVKSFWPAGGMPQIELNAATPMKPKANHGTPLPALPVPSGIGRTAQDVLRQTAPAAGSARRLAPSRLGSLLSGSSRSVVDEDKPWNDDRAFIPCGLGHVVFEGLNCFAALVCTGLLGWLVINQILTGCPGFLGSFEFKVDKEGTPLGPFEC